MRITMMTAVLATVTMMTSVAVAKDVPIEPNAVMAPEMQELTDKGQIAFQKMLNTSANLIRLNGWRCDSISAFTHFMFSRGFRLTCNGFSYRYEIQDRGGQWTVTLK